VSSRAHRGPNGRGLLGATVALLVAAAGLDFANAAGPVVVIGFLFTLIHGSVALGVRNVVAFVLLAVAVSFTAEAVGVATGAVFSPYHYTDDLGPKILGVPPVIQAAYVAMVYASFMTASAILGVDGNSTGWPGAALALAATIVMVSWDLAMDPLQSTLEGNWIWEDGGAYFGVPIHNYVGWFGTALVFLLIYQLWEARHPVGGSVGAVASRLFRAQPTIFYGILALGIVITPLQSVGPDQLAAPENYDGTVSDLERSMSLVAMVVMGGYVILALLRIVDTGRAATERR
jgi:uncharacterized membrane protein